MFLKSNNILKLVYAYENKIIKFNKVNFKKRVQGGGWVRGRYKHHPPPYQKPKFFPHPYPHPIKLAFPR